MRRRLIKERVAKTKKKQDVTPYQGDEINIEEALEIFVRAKEAEGVRPRTIHAYHNHIGYLIDYFTEIKGVQKPFLDDLTSDLIREYITYQLTEKRRYEGEKGRKDKTVGLSPNTVNIRLRTLRTMCRFWYTEGLAAVNAMENVKLVRTDEQPEVPGLSDKQVQTVINSMDEKHYAEWRDKILILLLIDTGMRINEAVSLTLSDINFKDNMIVLSSERTKNRRYRDVPVSLDVIKLLLELNKESQEYFGSTEQIFLNAYGEPFNSDSFRKRLNRLKSELGMERLSPHMFRHTFARDYLLNGGDLFTLQKILDHADIKTTRKYIQMSKDHLRSQHKNYTPARKYLKRKPKM
ncbi:tyrosine-type recombinase/integrase [Virgibacillus dokdonensis]|uniref:Tyrosine recombinase XerC n=1 Tax=Virgibacillus dokdonensis TaxID=302167 RepID=A0A2K9J1R3_9BACI|nr:tyrosine-type recombinase/integrase [Virgibacillus dokdonensis]AUJ25826.1 Tyrosine recombinase XerC [Virgibacillus dokdonensis]